ncbi:flagellar basal body rod modification protein [Roseovarius sp. A21]|uniref:Basal-body rod modification protein FlgD n=1 Tax=Roseovarius bejariae TaxID=2576383 RepID=A0A844CXR9_9RHOB|nr:flagellar hook capping FlgD N-terminal domain-containing protein [Roseovarius bejariae]MRU15440.1 flagellar basal body rod modification protein [Roseovarius bejariae]
MEISPNPGTTPQPATRPETQGQSGEAVLSSDFETFLKMLTTQMENQDPLNPMDSAEFATQLATFSSVEQQVMTNDLLTDLNNQIGALGMAQLSGWIGMEAQAEMPLAYDGSPVPLTLRTSSLADSAQLLIRDSNGTLVQRLDVPARGGTFTWAGRDAGGATLPDGDYSATVESISQGDVIERHPAQVHATIVEARQDAGQTRLVMSGGQTVLADEIIALRDPAG